MSDEFILIAALLGGMAALTIILLRQSHRRMARLITQPEIEIPIHSMARSLVVIIPSLVVGPVIMGVLAKLTDPWARQHALAATLLGIGLAGAGLLVGIVASSRYRRVGALRYTPTQLALEPARGQEPVHIALSAPFQLIEARSRGPSDAPVQVLALRQGEQLLAFSYMLPMTRAAVGERELEVYPRPLLGGEARVIHERLQALHTARTVDGS